jgi:hypothetical protein
MHRIQAHEKLTTRQRSEPLKAARPVVEVRSTHACHCPICSREVRIIATVVEANVHGGCEHVVRLEHLRGSIDVLFDEAPRRKRAGVGVLT